MNPYEQAARVLLSESGCTVRKWRTKNTGAAWTSADDWGIETPRPRGHASFAVLAHEVGHQMLHRHNGNKQRWLEEVEAWEYALAQFDRFDLPGREKVVDTARRSIRYAAAKAVRRRCSDATAATMRERLTGWRVVPLPSLGTAWIADDDGTT